MAVPFNLPSDERTEQNYQRLNDLFLTLYEVLRQILLHSEPPRQTDNNQQRNNVVAAAPREPTPPPPPPPSDAVAYRLPLPDIVVCSTPTTPRRPRRRSCATSTAPETHPVPPPRRGRRRRTPQDAAKETTSYRYTMDARGEVLRKIEVRDNWSQVGEDLRKIADEFHHTTLQDHEVKTLSSSPHTPRGPAGCGQDRGAIANAKGANLLSLLVPAPFSGSLWMAVIFLVGWGVLQKAR